ncbi:2-isopropylmalate synthase/homocitrate synthase family protein [Planctopirus limnophila DSM 3776]|uniref:Citramalate synthase n=1 Tax=Planctopirus limnophila (strain ATCC 43296 / DSM 3776 / IFAM 1008 / Mu 290) TaxID=521674 RepID=D5SYW5_PLAL2|nr:citramalate synthase [Planctopirus limnophila]ADG67897.1 2-isopropylmalate synthase/homocitrate synthase family protein [Planctopirus limnophila DSM 3776]
MARIQLYDTTLRDGSQGEGVNFSLQDKLLITQKLDEIGLDIIEGGYPLSNPKDAEYFQRVRDLPLKHAKISAFGMTRRKGVTADQDTGMLALRDARTPCCTVVGKTWDLHVFEVLRVDEAENLAMIRDSVAFLAAEGRHVIYDAEHFFDGFKANPEFALKTLRAAADSGAALLCLCDTNGGTMPEEIAAAVNAVRKELSTPLGIHCHNDCELAVANSLIAVDCGAIQVQGTINGIGERCGNVDLVSVAANLALKKHHEVLKPNGIVHLTELSRYVYEIANLQLRPGQPFVGSSAFAHKGGMHVHAVNRLARSYEHIPPETVGNERKVLVSELSGRSNIIAKTTKYRIAEDDQLMRNILERVQDLENIGYQFEAAEGSFDLLVRKEAGLYTPKFQRLHYRVGVVTEEAQVPVTEATVKLRVGDEVEHVVAEGDGPINALDTAVRRALLRFYPALEQMHLVDYKVRVINSAEGTAARVRVVIESRDDHDTWSTVGVSENVIEASWLALVDSVEYKLFKDEGLPE